MGSQWNGRNGRDGKGKRQRLHGEKSSERVGRPAVSGRPHGSQPTHRQNLGQLWQLASQLAGNERFCFR